MDISERVDAIRLIDSYKRKTFPSWDAIEYETSKRDYYNMQQENFAH